MSVLQVRKLELRDETPTQGRTAGMRQSLGENTGLPRAALTRHPSEWSHMVNESGYCPHPHFTQSHCTQGLCYNFPTLWV